MEGVEPLLLFLVICATAVGSCKPQGQRVNFSSLEPADRIEVVTNLRKPVKTIRDPVQIQAAWEFAQQHQDGWSEHWAGPLVPTLQLEFYQGNRYLGGYGVARAHLVSDPSTAGFVSRDVPSAAVAELLIRLGVTWPSP